MFFSEILFFGLTYAFLGVGGVRPDTLKILPTLCNF